MATRKTAHEATRSSEPTRPSAPARKPRNRPAPAVREEDDGKVRHLVLCRADEFNTITPQLRDELVESLDRADRSAAVRVVLLRAEGRAFCAGFGLDWSTRPGTTDSRTVTAQNRPTEAGADRAWDSIADLAMIGRFAEAFAKLNSISKPTLAAVQGWCIAGGTDMILNADLIIAGESATFGYPPARVWGTPEAMWVWIARLGLERTKRYLFTGDEIPAPEAARIGMILECVPDVALQSRALEMAHRMAKLPMNQLQMMKLLTNDVARQLYAPDRSRTLSCLMDGVARHTQEGMDFIDRSAIVGWRNAVRERDAPFGDYGERRRDRDT